MTIILRSSRRETPHDLACSRRPAGPRDHAIFTGWINIAGLPAISVPVGLSKSGLPIGVQFAAGFGADAALLQFARDFARQYSAPSCPMRDE